MSDRKTFEYGGYHFTPIRKFHKKEGDFFVISKRLASDPNLGLCTYQDRQKAPYDYKDFYTVSTDKECDIFRCEENGLLYVPGKNELCNHKVLFADPDRYTALSWGHLPAVSI